MSTASVPAEEVGRPGAPGKRGKTGLALLVIVLSQFMVGIDATVVNIALPQIHADLEFTATGLAWVSSSYTLAFAGLLLLGSRIGDIFGRRRIFIIGLVVFAIASLLGGLSDSAELLILWRVVQGVAAALAAPNSLALVAGNFEEGPQRNKAFGMVASAYAASLAVGLILGGLLTEAGTWRWVMFINVPLALVVLILAPLHVKEAERHPGKADWAGMVLSTATMATFVYGLLNAAERGWSDMPTYLALGASLVLLIAFLFVESRTEQPLMPLDLFSSRTRTGGYFTLVGLVATMAAMNFFVSQLLQDVFGYTPLIAGLAFLPMAAAIMIASSQAAKLLAKVGAKPLILGGSAIIFAGMAWLSTVSLSSNYFGSVLGPILLFGIGAGFAFTAVSVTILSDVSGRNAGSAAGVLEVMQWIGFTLGISVLVAVFGAAFRGAGEIAPGDVRFGMVEGMGAAFLASLVFVGLAFLIALFVISKPAAPAAEATQPGNAEATPAD
ncbi:MFS transporter [Actinosynnema sp. CS-041913]|uniref:MFS transporter n=1 Tax=Actinosynnema sp. CS-041913 TaxID=3239917 RepID=UPI003D936AEB